MPSALAEKLSGVRDLKKILETAARELGETYHADTCQIALSDPLDPNATAIYEYKSNGHTSGATESLVLPLDVQGNPVGQVALACRHKVSPAEIEQVRNTLAQLGDIFRNAQVNEVVQRDTFRETFLIEIGNVMSYSLGIGDALFMVVNILGKALQVSRCLFVCTDDAQAGWKSYEYWQQGKVQSNRDFGPPTADSPILAQTLLAKSPLIVFEGQSNAHATPVQEELQFIQTRSLLGVPLVSEVSTHGCVILQQCDYRRAWTRAEIDMVQSVADSVAMALAKLPAEKLSREPIMQLHQRTIAPPSPHEETIQSVRRALKGALGQQAIPSAGMALPPAKPVAPTTPVSPATPAAPVAQAAPTIPAVPAAPAIPSAPATSKISPEAEEAELEKQLGYQPSTTPPISKKWAELDAIPTPAANKSKAGLSSTNLNKPRGPVVQSSLLASLHKDKEKFAPPKVEYVEAPLEIDEATAKSKLKEVLGGSNPASDYIFATVGVDPRTLGRIAGWVSEIEAKDKYANGHFVQVAQYSSAIAAEMGMNEQQIEVVRLAALVHDVGKLGTIPAILQKPDGELNDAELLTFMKHPLDGAELLEQFPDLAMLAPIVKAHHEEFDGKGYPLGLFGEHIPIEARIIGVASMYHQLVAQLRFREGVAPEIALQELQGGSGSMFDPQVVDALILALQHGLVEPVM